MVPHVPLFDVPDDATSANSPKTAVHMQNSHEQVESQTPAVKPISEGNNTTQSQAKKRSLQDSNHVGIQAKGRCTTMATKVKKQMVAEHRSEEDGSLQDRASYYGLCPMFNHSSHRKNALPIPREISLATVRV